MTISELTTLTGFFPERSMFAALAVICLMIMIMTFGMAKGRKKVAAEIVLSGAFLYFSIGWGVGIAASIKTAEAAAASADHQDNHQPYIPQTYNHPLELENYKLIQRLEKSDIAKRMCWAELQESQE